MKRDWIKHSFDLACAPADFYTSDRKIIRRRQLTFRNWDDDLSMEDLSYGDYKSTLLRKNYFNVESRQVAIDLWQRRRGLNKYGSVSFTTFNHYVKGSKVVNGEIPEDAGIGSVFGPCIQAVSITYIDKETSAVDVFYRTTEWFKKFPADLVFIRDELLGDDFILGDFDVTFHFANITMHPMYFITLLPFIDPIPSIERIHRADPIFYSKILKWLGRYLIDDTGIIKFAQAMRTKDKAVKKLGDTERLVDYVHDNLSKLQASNKRRRS